MTSMYRVYVLFHLFLFVWLFTSYVTHAQDEGKKIVLEVHVGKLFIQQTKHFCKGHSPNIKLATEHIHHYSEDDGLLAFVPTHNQANFPLCGNVHIEVQQTINEHQLPILIIYLTSDLKQLPMKDIMNIYNAARKIFDQNFTLTTKMSETTRCIKRETDGKERPAYLVLSHSDYQPMEKVISLLNTVALYTDIIGYSTCQHYLKYYKRRFTRSLDFFNLGSSSNYNKRSLPCSSSNNKPIAKTSSYNVIVDINKFVYIKLDPNMFVDAEDDHRTLKLHMEWSNGRTITYSDWLQYNGVLQLMYTWATYETFMKQPKDGYSFVVTAMDSCGATGSINYIVKINSNVQPPCYAFELLVESNLIADTPRTHLLGDMVNILAIQFNDAKLSKHFVQSLIQHSAINSRLFSLLFSDSTISCSPCNVNKIRQIETTSQNNPAFHSAFPPNFKYLGFTVKWDSCSGHSPPITLRSLPQLTINNYGSLQYEIPADTFYDAEEGFTNNLKLSIVSSKNIIATLQYMKLSVYQIENNPISTKSTFTIKASDNKNQQTELQIHINLKGASPQPPGYFSFRFTAYYSLSSSDAEILNLVMTTFSKYLNTNSMKNFNDYVIVGFARTGSFPQYITFSFAFKTFYHHTQGYNQFLFTQTKLFSQGSVSNMFIADTIQYLRDITGQTHDNYNGYIFVKPTMVQPTMMQTKINPHPSTTIDNISPSTVSTQPSSKVPHIEGPIALYQIGPFKVTFCDFMVFPIPDNLFKDDVDGSTRRLKLSLTDAGHQPVSTSSWIFADSDIQVIYGYLKVEDYIELRGGGANKNTFFHLVATNSRGGSTSLRFSVELPEKIPDILYTVSMKVTPFYQPSIPEINEQLMLLTKISAYFGLPSKFSWINVISFKRQPNENQITIAWTNCTLTGKQCHNKDVSTIASKVVLDNGQPNSVFARFLSPQYIINEIRATTSSQCQQTTTSTLQPTSSVIGSSYPIIVNNMPTLEVTTLNYFTYKIPFNTFYDSTDGYTPYLTLSMSSNAGKPIPRSSWIQFNAAAQEINAFLYVDILNGREVENFQFVLTATNSFARSKNMVINIQCRRKVFPMGGFYVEFSGREYFNQIMNNIQVLTILLQRYFQYTGNRYKTEIVCFQRNTGLNFRMNFVYHRVIDSSNGCNVTELYNLQKILLTNQGQINSDFMFAFLPEAVASHVTITTFGSCLNLPTTTPSTPQPVILNQIQPLVISNAGFFQYSIPEKTFYDAKDGFTPMMQLKLLDQYKTGVRKDSWITLSNNQVILASPSGMQFPNTRTNQFYLRVINSQLKFTDLALEVTVINQSPVGALRITLTGVHKFQSSSSTVDIIIYIMEKLNSYLYDQTNRKETVLISFYHSSSTFTMHLDDASLIGDICSSNTFRTLEKKIYITPGNIHPQMVMELFPQVSLTQVQFSKQCNRPITTSKPTTTEKQNTPPYVNQPIQPIHISFGRLLFKYISPQTFLDREDGDARHLQLTLLHNDGGTVQRDNWVQMNQNTLLIYGSYTLQDYNMLPLDKYRYMLRATDSKGSFTATPIIFERPSTSLEYSFKIRTTITMFYDSTTSLVNEQILFITKINSYITTYLRYGIQIITFARSILTKQLIIEWALDNLSDDICPWQTLQLITDKFVSNSQPSSGYRSIMRPEYSVSSVEIQRMPSCQQITISPSPSSTTTHLQTSTSIPTTPIPEPPTINTNIFPIRLSTKQSAIFIYYIPSNAFNNPMNSHLKLDLLTEEGRQLENRSWVSFNKQHNYIYGMLIEDMITSGSSDVYRLQATNGGGSVYSQVTITIPALEKKLHSITIVFRTRDTFFKYADLTALVIGQLSLYLRQSGVINLLSIIKMQGNFWSVQFAASTQIVDYCNMQQYFTFRRKFVVDTLVSTLFKNFVYPEMEVLQAYASNEQCQNVTTTTTTTPTPNVNLPPTVLKLFAKVTATTCEVFEFQIPNNSFFDVEDGLTSNLAITIQEPDGGELPKDVWLVFNETTRTLRGLLTLTEAVNSNQFVYRVVATDKAGLSVFQMLTIHVSKPQNEVDGHMVETYGTILQQIETNALKLLIHQKFLSYIQQKFTQGSVNGLQIHSMIIYPTNPKSMNLKWSICQRQCNQNVDIELKRILMVQNIQPNYDVMVLLHPTAHVTSVSITGDTKCRTTTTTTTTPTKVTPSPNTPPTINRVIPILTVEGCKLLDYQIPHDTCFDKEDGYTAKLHIKLLHENKTEVGDSSWIHLNHATQKIYGILKISDLEGSPNNVFIFYLVCQDSGGLSVEHRFYILPSGTPMMPKYHFTMKSYIYVNEMMSDSEIQLLWIKRMKRYLGETEYNLQLIDMKRTTILYPQITIKWYNCSIQDPCSQDALHLKSLLLNDKNHHSLNEQFSRSMVPEFVLISGAMEQQQPCQVITTTTGTPALTTTPPVNQIPITVMKVLKVEIDVCEQVLYQIPANAFFDVEDGYTRNLKLSLTNKDDSKVDELCINFDKGAQTIYFRYVKDLFQNNLELKLTAMDSGGGSATSDLVITTKANVAELSHWFSMRSYVYNIVPQKLNILNSFTAKLQHFFSDKSGGQIMFKKLSYTDNYMEVEWSNCSLYTTCKNSSLLQMKSKMLMFDSSSIVNPQFISFMAPSFVITFLQMQYGDICYPHPSTTVVPTPSTQVTPQPSVTPTHGLNTPPRVMKEIPVYNVPLCALFSFRIPQDTFYDREDGGTRNLRLELRQFNDQELASTSWIQFVESTQVVYGQFRQEGNNMDSKYISYILRAYDRSSLNTFTVITMKTPPMDTVPYFIEAEFTRFYDENTPELISQLFLTSKISTYLGEQNVGNVLAISYKRTPNTIELSWTNCRLIDRSCQNNEVQDNISKFATNGVDQINDGFRRAMDPYYIVKKVLVNTSNCDKLPRTTIIPSPSSSMYPSMSSIFTNRPPRVNGIIEPIPLKKCGSFSYTIPNNLFIDEDGNTRNLRIQFFDIYGNEVNNRTSWVQYNPKLFLIYGLIKCSDIEKQPDAGYQYILEASDSQGLSVFTILPFQKLDQITRIGFEIEMEIECSFDAVTPYLNDIFQIINKIVFFFGDHNMDNIKVVKFFEKPGSIGTIIFKWTNCTFDFTTCPTDQIELLVQKITSSNGAFVKSFEPNYRVKSIEYVYNSPCQKPTTTLAPTTTPLPSPPKVVNYISTIITKRCANLHFPIPEKTFYDDEDGWTRNLTLLLMTVTDEKLSSGSWIQFDQQSQTIIGRPAKLTNIPDPYQSFIYNLVAMDKEGNQSPLVIRIDVLSDPKPNTINQNFTLILKKNFPINIPDVKAYKERLKTKIASYYGDTGSYFIDEIDFASDQNSLQLSWSNCTVNGPSCNNTLARLIKDKIMDLSGKCRTQFAFIFLPEFTVKELTMQINSDCGIITSTITPTTAALVTPSSSISPMPDTTIKVLVDEINIPVDYCKQVEYMIPENIFHDEATGNSRSFTYSLLYEDKLTVTCSSWLQLNVTSGNELYGNMLQTQPVNPVKYKLRALNEVGASATSDILIDTTQLEKLNISYRAAFSFQTTLDEKICDAELLFILKEKLKTYFGDDTTSYTSFLFFSRGTKQQPSYVMWTNCTIRTDICDFRHINEITDKLFVDDQSLVVKPALIEALKPEFTDLSVLEEKLGPCDANEVLSVGLSPDPICVDTCGEFIYKLNDSMFIDPEDGNTSKLIIEMTNKDSTPLAPNSWIQFDQVNKEIFGFPSESVIVNEPSEGYVYLINAYDSQGAAASVPVTFKMCRGLPSYDGSVTVKLKCNKTITKAIHIVEDTLHRISEAYYDGTLADFFLVNYQLKMNDMNFTWTNCTGSVDFDLEQLQNSLNDSDCQPINVTITDHKDYPPIVVRDNLRFDISFCHPKNYTIPFDSIVDGEDGDLRNMTVYLAFQNMQPLPSDYFVALYKDSLEVIFMATNQTKSKIIYEYYLVAVDKRNQTARMMLYFEVMDDFPPVNYLIGTKLRAPSNIATVQSINDYFDAINQYMNYNSTWLVNDYQGFSNGTIIIRYTQCTHSYPKCDHKNIETFRSTFMSEDGQINPDVIAAMFPRFRIQSIDTERYKDCLLEPNTPPEKHHNLNVTIKRCGITKYRIPEDTFFDKEDGNTGNLTLKLYRDEDTQCWLKFNATDQQMTLLYDSGKAGQTFNFTIQATDVRGESVNATLTVFFEERGRISYQLVFLFDIVETLPCFEEKYFVSETMLTYFNNTEEIGVASISKGPDNLLMEVVVEHCDMDFSPCNYIVMDRLTKALQDGNSLKREFIDSFSTDKYIPRYLSQRKGEPCLDRSNTAPLSQGEIGLVNVTACTNQTDLFLPRDLVMDNEDGDWSNMKKVLYKVLESGGKTLVTSKDWIQMNGVSIMIIYVRSLANAQPEEGYHFLIDVTDSRGSQIEVPLTVTFERDRPNITFAINMSLALRQTGTVDSIKSWKVGIEKNLSLTIEVLNYMFIRENTIQVEWTICGMSKDGSRCPYEEIKKIEQYSMDVGEQVNMTRYGKCLEPPSRPPNSTDVSFILDPCLKINYTIPDDVFFDDKDGGTSNLTLKVVQNYPTELADFITYDEKRYCFHGIVMLEFFDRYKRLEYLIQATDSDGLMANATLRFVAHNITRQYQFRIRATYFGQPRTEIAFATEFCYRFEKYLREINLNAGVTIYNVSSISEQASSSRYDITVTPCALTGPVCNKQTSTSITDQLVTTSSQPKFSFIREMLDLIVPDKIDIVQENVCRNIDWHSEDVNYLKASICNKKQYSKDVLVRNATETTTLVFDNLYPWMTFDERSQIISLNPTLRELETQPEDGYLLLYNIRDGNIQSPKQNTSVMIEGDPSDYNFMVVLHLKSAETPITSTLDTTKRLQLINDIQMKINEITKDTKFNFITVIDVNSTSDNILRVFLYDCNLNGQFCQTLLNGELYETFTDSEGSIKASIQNTFQPEYKLENITTSKRGRCNELPKDRPYVTDEIPPMNLSLCQKLDYRLPKGLFMDTLDGEIKGERIQLCDEAGNAITSPTYIKYNTQRNSLQAILTQEQLKKFGDRKLLMFYLKANNSRGELANTSFVLHLPELPVNNLIIQTYASSPYSPELKSDLDVLLDVCARIENHIRSTNESISVIGLDRTKDTITLEWTTCNMMQENCSSEQVNQIIDKIYGDEERIVFHAYYVQKLGENFGYPHIKTNVRETNYCLYPDGNEPPKSTGNISLVVEQCGYFEKKLDNDIFTDQENGDITNLTLSMKFTNGSSIKPDYWIQYNDETKIIYGIVDDSVRMEENYTFLLEAVDDSAEKANGFVFVYLKENATLIRANQENGMITLQCSNKKTPSLKTITNILDQIAQKISSSHQDIYLKRFFKNETTLVIEYLSCKEINLSPSKQLVDTAVDSCVVEDVVIVPKPQPTTTTTTTTRKPKVRETLDIINITCGQPSEYKIKETTFEDDDGSTSNLTLQVLDKFEDVADYPYLTFNTSTQTITTFVSTKDCQQTDIEDHYNLQATDKDGNSVISKFEIRKIPKTVSCCMYIQTEVSNIDQLDEKLRFYKTLQETVYTGNSTSKDIVLVDIYRNSTSNKDIAVYTDGQITNETCFKSNTRPLTDPVFSDPNMTIVQPSFVQSLNQYEPTDTRAIAEPACNKTVIPVVPPPPETSAALTDDFIGESDWFLYLLPLFILAFMLLMCCFCYYCCRYCYKCCVAPTQKEKTLPYTAPYTGDVLPTARGGGPSPLPYSTLPKERYDDDPGYDDSIDAAPKKQGIIALPITTKDVQMQEAAVTTTTTTMDRRRQERMRKQSSIIQPVYVDQQEEANKIDFDEEFNKVYSQPLRDESSTLRTIQRTKVTSNSMDDMNRSREMVSQRLATSRPVTTSYIAGTAPMTNSKSFTHSLQRQQDNRVTSRDQTTRRMDTRRNLRLPAIPTGPPPPYSPPRFQRVFRQNIIPSYYERYLRHRRNERSNPIVITEDVLPAPSRRNVSRVLVSPKPKQIMSLPIKRRKRERERERVVTPVITIPDSLEETSTISDDSSSIEMKAILKGKQHSIRRLLQKTPIDETTLITPLVRKKKKKRHLPKEIIEIPTTSFKSKTKRRYSVSSSPLLNNSRDTLINKKSRSHSKFKHKFSKPYLYDYIPVKRKSVRRSKRYKPQEELAEPTITYSTLSRKHRRKESKKLPTLEELLDDSLDINDKVDLNDSHEGATDTLKKKRASLKNDQKISWIDLKDINLKE